MNSRWMLLVCLLATLILLIVPPVNAPETAFDETDIPIGLTPGTLPRIDLEPPALQEIALPSLTAPDASPDRDFAEAEITAVANRRSAQSLQSFLCTLLI